MINVNTAETEGGSNSNFVIIRRTDAEVCGKQLELVWQSQVSDQLYLQN
jgi:hypothetical protein